MTYPLRNKQSSGCMPCAGTWIKAIKAGNFVGWPLLTARNVRKYYPETSETPKGHMAQTRKNVRSTKPKPFEESDTAKLKKKKERDVYIKVMTSRSSKIQSIPTKQAASPKHLSAETNT